MKLSEVEHKKEDKSIVIEFIGKLSKIEDDRKHCIIKEVKYAFNKSKIIYHKKRFLLKKTFTAE
jgi:hypothetical protein